MSASPGVRFEIGVGCAAATPIVVAGRPWGAIVAASRHPWRLPADAEACMDQFAELAAPAIARTESHASAGRLADEQAAVRRVGMVVAGGGPAAVIFDAVAAVMGQLVGADRVVLSAFTSAQYNGDRPQSAAIGLEAAGRAGPHQR